MKDLTPPVAGAAVALGIIFHTQVDGVVRWLSDMGALAFAVLALAAGFYIAVERVEYPGETGIAYWRTRDFGGIRVRMPPNTRRGMSRITGAKKVMSCCVLKVSCIRRSRMAAPSC